MKILASILKIPETGALSQERVQCLTVISSPAILSIGYHNIISMIDFTIMTNWIEIDWLNFTSKIFTLKSNWLISNSQAFALKLNRLKSIYQWLIKNEFIWYFDHQLVESYWCYQIPTPEVSLGVLSPQGRHSATYTEHMLIKQLHTMIQHAYLENFP